MLKITLPSPSKGKPGLQKYQPHQLRNHAAKQAGTTAKTIGRYVQKGSTYSLLGGAGTLLNIFLISQINSMMFILGSIYLLAILATSMTKNLVGQLKGDQALRLAALIRCPPPGTITFNFAISLLIIVIPLVDTSEGRMIIQTIIPAIAKLRSLFNLNMTSIFSYQLLLENGFPVTLKASELKESDRLFDNISYKLVVI